MSLSLESERMVTTLTQESTAKWSRCDFKVMSEKVMQLPLGSLETLVPQRFHFRNSLSVSSHHAVRSPNYMPRPCFSAFVNSLNWTTLLNEKDIWKWPLQIAVIAFHHLSLPSWVPKHYKAKRVNPMVPFHISDLLIL